jgi:hypothetical protein
MLLSVKIVGSRKNFVLLVKEKKWYNMVTKNYGDELDAKNSQICLCRFFEEDA